ncbi:MAG: hypothetical protein J2P45_02860 [Candidatus Dormibacteraeota bacterium]|nr:hypothetical protein [Candidatus Dormibacteraeota bacterium]
MRTVGASILGLFLGLLVWIVLTDIAPQAIARLVLVFALIGLVAGAVIERLLHRRRRLPRPEERG